MLARRRELRLERIGVASGNRLVAAEHLRRKLFVYLAGRAAVFAVDIALDLLADGLVPLAEQHVHGRLYADHLRERRDKRRIAEVGTHARRFFEHPVELVDGVLRLELSDEVGEHAAGNLINEGVGLGREHVGVEQAVVGELILDGQEVVVDLFQLLGVHAAVVAHLRERIHERLSRRLARAAREARGRAVDAGRARLRRLEVGHVAEAGGGVGVDVNRDADVFAERRNEVEALLRAHDARHVLDTERMTAHLLDLSAEGDKHFEVVDRTERVADAALCVAAGLDALVHCGFDVAQVVERVEDADDVHAVFDALAHEAAHGVIRIMMVAEQILTAQQHLQLGVFQMGFDIAEPLPRVLVEIAQAAVECCAAPALDGVIPGLVHLVEDALEVGIRHSGRNQRLLRIAQNGLGDVYLFHILPLLWQQSRPSANVCAPCSRFFCMIVSYHVQTFRAMLFHAEVRSDFKDFSKSRFPPSPLPRFAECSLTFPLFCSILYVLSAFRNARSRAGKPACLSSSAG